MENGEWRMENGEWRMENGAPKGDRHLRSQSPEGLLRGTTPDY
jgi:hypothetical protein